VDLLQGEVDVGKLAASALVGNHVLRVVVFAWGEGREGGREGGRGEGEREKKDKRYVFINSNSTSVSLTSPSTSSLP
jgi:hypothetical protein